MFPLCNDNVTTLFKLTCYKTQITEENRNPHRDMIDNKTIDNIYKKYSKRPASIDQLNIPLLFEAAHEDHAIEIKGHDLIINSQEKWSPFHTIDLNRVHAILDFDKSIAIVLHSSILFISKTSADVKIHIRDVRPSLSDRLRGLFCACL